jgi:hypothetical protein
MCYVWISEETAIISLYSINWLVCITEKKCVYCAVWTGSINTIEVILRFIRTQAIILQHRMWIFMSSWIPNTLPFQNTEKSFVRKAIICLPRRTVPHSKRPNLAIYRLRKFKFQNTKNLTEHYSLCSVQRSSASSQILTVCVLRKPLDCLLFQLGVFLAHVDTRHYATSQCEVEISSVYIHCKLNLSWAAMGTSDRIRTLRVRGVFLRRRL